MFKIPLIYGLPIINDEFPNLTIDETLKTLGVIEYDTETEELKITVNNTLISKTQVKNEALIFYFKEYLGVPETKKKGGNNEQ